MRLIDADMVTDIIAHLTSLEPRDADIMTNVINKAPTIVSTSLYAEWLEEEGGSGCETD